jgi:type VI secretion system protein ImpF
MSSRPLERQRLQPALLDRLTDDAPDERQEPLEARVIGKAQLRQAVLRDLTWLMNAVQPGSIDPARFALPASSTLNFGLPALSGSQASMLHVGALEAAIRRAIILFEPRILADSLTVRAVESDSVLDTHNVIQIEIRGLLWAQPVPLELLIRTQLDLESGQVVVEETY